jgi:hypothetical protein
MSDAVQVHLVTAGALPGTRNGHRAHHLAAHLRMLNSDQGTTDSHSDSACGPITWPALLVSVEVYWQVVLPAR